MREHKDRMGLHQRRHPNRRPHVVGKHEEGGAVRNQALVQRHTINDRSHRMLADAKMQVASLGLGCAERGKSVQPGLGGGRQVG